MLPNKIKQLLLENWGDKANALDCFIEVKFIDIQETWECYIFALNPVDEDEICCLMVTKDGYEFIDWSLKELMQTFDDNGEYPVVDQEFRRIHITKIINRLKGK